MNANPKQLTRPSPPSRAVGSPFKSNVSSVQQADCNYTSLESLLHRIIQTLTSIAIMMSTLANKLGTSTHYSPLLRKVRCLGLKAPDDLWTLAVQRGCRHYRRGNEPTGELVPLQTFSNEELALALLNTAGVYSSHSIRCGAAMLGAAGNDAGLVARLALHERSEAVIRFVAECGKTFEPDNSYWPALLSLLRPCPPIRPGVMPHPTRFVAMSGYQRGVGKNLITEWQRPTSPAT